MVNEIFMKILLAFAVAGFIADILWIFVKAVILVSCAIAKEPCHVNFKSQLWAAIFLSAGVIYYFL